MDRLSAHIPYVMVKFICSTGIHALIRVASTASYLVCYCLFLCIMCELPGNRPYSLKKKFCTCFYITGSPVACLYNGCSRNKVILIWSCFQIMRSNHWHQFTCYWKRNKYVWWQKVGKWTNGTLLSLLLACSYNGSNIQGLIQMK